MIPFAGIVDGWREKWAAIKVLFSKWHASGPQCRKLEEELARYIGVRYALTTNSGSSALLLALKSIGLPKNAKVITSGCGFPATLNPILHCGYKPVLVDYDMETQNIDLLQVEEAMKAGADAIIVAHTMGIPVDMRRLMVMADEHNVIVIEDCCEAIGAQLDGHQVGSFGHLACFSFYPSHQVNGLGTGGAVTTNNEEWAKNMRSMRNWGKIIHETKWQGDHVSRYTNDVDGVMYDDQYTYKTVGFNFLMADICAAYLREQMKRLPELIKKRKENWAYLNDRVGARNKVRVKVPQGAEPSYFGYVMVNPKRDELANHLEANGVRQRPFFAGNITRHEPYKKFKTKFPVADRMMEEGLFIGCWPGLKRRQLDHMINTIWSFK
jgi:CDP-6-deoxy-D-xylo-4-hexulose-3-dehydrase